MLITSLATKKASVPARAERLHPYNFSNVMERGGKDMRRLRRYRRDCRVAAKPVAHFLHKHDRICPKPDFV
jgi:hypothetical protein